MIQNPRNHPHLRQITWSVDPHYLNHVTILFRFSVTYSFASRAFENDRNPVCAPGTLNFSSTSLLITSSISLLQRACFPSSVNNSSIRGRRYSAQESFLVFHPMVCPNNVRTAPISKEPRSPVLILSRYLMSFFHHPICDILK